MNRNISPFRHAPAQAQRGVVLVTALIFLVLITILAISASGTSLLQQKLAGGLRNAQLAEWSAESALRGAEWRLWTATLDDSTRLSCGTSGVAACYPYSSDPVAAVKNFRNSSGWVIDGAVEYKPVNFKDVSSDKTFALKNNPYYIIEDMGIEKPQGAGMQSESGATGVRGVGYQNTVRHIYRITARGMGNNDNAIRVLETTFAAKAN